MRVLSFVLLLLVLSSAMPLSAFASNATDPAPASSAFESSASDFWYEIEGGEVTVTGYKGSSPSLVIPSTIDGYPVTAIHSAAFYGNRTIESAVIGDGVRKIGDGAFWGCTNLLSVSIGSGIVSIPEYAFCDCTSLSSLTFSNGLAEIGESAFSGCTSLVSLRLPESLFAIRQSAYKNCTALSDVVIPTSVLIIEDDAFYKTPWLDSLSGDPVIVGGGVLMKMQNGFREDLVIPEGVVSVYSRSSFTYAYVKTVFLPSSMRYWTQLGVELEAESFAVDQANPYLTAPEGVLYTKDMRELLAYPSKKGGAYTIPQGVLTIGPGAFIGEVSAVTLCDGLLQIGEQAFFNSKITEILIPSSVLAIGACAFQYCSSLRSVVLPSALCEIEASVFDGCSALESVSIGREVTSIGICAFSGCSSLSQVEFRGTKSEWDRIEIGMLNSPLTSASLSCTAQDAHTHEFGDFVEYDEATHLGVCRCGESTTEGHI